MSIKVDDLPYVKFADLESLPEISAVYFAVSMAGEILYVGKTINLKTRWRNHHRHKQLVRLWCEKIAWLEYDAADLLEHEYRMIHIFRPILNRALDVIRPGRIKKQTVEQGSKESFLSVTSSLGMEGHVGQRLRHIREKHHFTVRALEKASGVPYATISRIENAAQDPRFSTLDRLAIALGESVAVFSEAWRDKTHG
jgi:hypothetical protein